MTERETAALRFLEEPDVEARIKGAAAFEFDRKLRTIAASILPDAAKERRADAAEDSCLRYLRRIMSAVAVLHRDFGEAAAREMLEVLPS